MLSDQGIEEACERDQPISRRGDIVRCNGGAEANQGTVGAAVDQTSE